MQENTRWDGQVFLQQGNMQAIPHQIIIIPSRECDTNNITCYD